MATDVKFSQESIERQLHGNGGSSMNKKKIGITFVALVCLAVVVLTIFYMISNGKISGSRESKSSTTEVDKLMSCLLYTSPSPRD